MSITPDLIERQEQRNAAQEKYFDLFKKRTELFRCKPCGICQQPKTLMEFNCDRSKKDGRKTYCRECQKKYQRERRQQQRLARIPADLPWITVQEEPKPYDQFLLSVLVLSNAVWFVLLLVLVWAMS